MEKSKPDVVDTIVGLFEKRGDETYAGELVSQKEHAIQTALLALHQEAPDHLIVAALLHDIGHILADADLPHSLDIDLHDQHETRGYDWLVQHFGIRIAEPIRLHVDAKRYLCTTDKAYEEKLSPVSLKSFYDQGGHMSPSELRIFEENPFAEDALELRKWDDQAKDPFRVIPGISSFIPVLQKCIVRM